nr:Ycf15 protein [Feroniella oblata]BEV76520.1 Ycf15 protein [Feroniella oblata]
MLLLKHRRIEILD